MKESRFENAAGRNKDGAGARTVRARSDAVANGKGKGPTRGDAKLPARKGDPIDGELPMAVSGNRINNAGSNPNGDARRSGGSPNDPDGGHELLGHEWRGPDPDPIQELLPGGQGAKPLPYSGSEFGAQNEQDRQDAVRLRAYHLWERAGRPDGRHESHWHQANAELNPQQAERELAKPIRKT